MTPAMLLYSQRMSWKAVNFANLFESWIIFPGNALLCWRITMNNFQDHGKEIYPASLVEIL